MASIGMAWSKQQTEQTEQSCVIMELLIQFCSNFCSNFCSSHQSHQFLSSLLIFLLFLLVPSLALFTIHDVAHSRSLVAAAHSVRAVER